MNTGRVGGKDGDERSKKVKIPHTSACVKGIAEQTIVFEEDPDFRYQVASERPGVRRHGAPAPGPRSTSGRAGSRSTATIVERLKVERVEHLQRFTELSEDIIKAAG